jgi:hypothetical protein
MKDYISERLNENSNLVKVDGQGYFTDLSEDEYS